MRFWDGYDFGISFSRRGLLGWCYFLAVRFSLPSNISRKALRHHCKSVAEVVGRRRRLYLRLTPAGEVFAVVAYLVVRAEAGRKHWERILYNPIRREALGAVTHGNQFACREPAEACLPNLCWIGMYQFTVDDGEKEITNLRGSTYLYIHQDRSECYM